MPNPAPDPSRPQDDAVHVEERADGAVVVRVRSGGEGAARLPDAVFAFRCGDPQYAYWLARLRAVGNAGRRSG